jgi:NTP pyrophosphatase (non-canonical NTP hydrolase)
MGGANGWALEKWALALAGETEEFCNLVKKIIRGDFLLEDKKQELLYELADVITYADLAVSKLGGETGAALLSKFHEVSGRHNWAAKIERIYLSASFVARDEMRAVRGQLQARRFDVTSRWLDFEWTTGDDATTAQIDLDDLEESDLCMVFTEWNSSRGGMFVEMGYALASAKPIVVIGPRPNNFFHLEMVKQFTTLDAWLEANPR